MFPLFYGREGYHSLQDFQTPVQEHISWHYPNQRGLLCGVLSTTTLVWINDPDAALHKTQDFLDRRIENVRRLRDFVFEEAGHHVLGHQAVLSDAAGRLPHPN